MGKHTEWRKEAKKLRRKRIRSQKAKLRDQLEIEELKQLQNTPSYTQFLSEKLKYDELKEAEAIKLKEEKEREWIEREKEAQKQFIEIQKKIALAREERAIQNEKIRLEWEAEQAKQQELKRLEEERLHEKLKQQEILDRKVEDFLENGGDTPAHLKTCSETNPNKAVCPFFNKTATCRFFDVCSRNHVRPGISRNILINNFFSHYSLEKTENEYLTDSNLEFENHETRAVYREFYKDVIPEIKKFGKIRLFLTCSNHETHLRGNVFIQFLSTQGALKCFRSLNGRWYGGKQLNLQFVNIPSWKSAVCGLHFSNRCPKGDSCNFLHPFRNPGNEYSALEEIKQDRDRNYSEPRNWRWSESPERPLKDTKWEVDDNPEDKTRHKYRRNGKTSTRSERSHRTTKESSRRSKIDKSPESARSYSRDQRENSDSRRSSRRSRESSTRRKKRRRCSSSE